MKGIMGIMIIRTIILSNHEVSVENEKGRINVAWSLVHVTSVFLLTHDILPFSDVAAVVM